jgi:branched-chain amino acid transport system substrate-binding protein
MLHRRVIRIGLVIGLLAGSLLLAACGSVGGPQTVKVAVTAPMGIEVGKDVLNAAQMALDEAGGKAGDVTVELLSFNTSDPEGSPVSGDLEREAALKAIEDPAVVAYLGPLTTDQAKEAMPLLSEASITQLSPSATWPGLTKPGYGPGEPGIYYPTGRRHFFRTVPSDEIQGAAAARWAGELGMQNIYVVEEGNAYGQGVAGIFELTARDVGLNLVGRESYDLDAVTAAELAEIAARVVEIGPDLVYFAGGYVPTGGQFVGLVRGLDRELAIMGPDGLVQDDLISDVGADLAEGVYGTNVVIPADQLESAAAADFRASFQAAYGKQPEPYVVSAYEGMKVLLRAIERAEEPTREGVLNSMQSLGDFSGVLGTWHFDERGDPSITAISGMQVQGGAWTFVQVIK